MKYCSKRVSNIEQWFRAFADRENAQKQALSNMNAYFEAAGVGLRWEDGDLVNRPERGNPAPNRNIVDYQ